MEISFEGKVALVTGASAGMGLAAAQAFADAGAAVVLADIDDAAAGVAAEKLVADGHQAIAVGCDVADEDQVAAMVEQTVSTFGRLDAAYNNAGIQTPNVETADASGDEFDKVNAINLRGVWNCMKHELRQMRQQGSGAIVNCSSIGGLVGIPGLAAYHASKHGVLGLTKSAALEYAPRGIRINAVCPGTIDTPMVARMIATDKDAMDTIMKDQPNQRLGRPTKSPTPCCGCAARWRASSSAMHWPSTVATPRDDPYLSGAARSCPGCPTPRDRPAAARRHFPTGPMPSAPLNPATRCRRQSSGRDQSRSPARHSPGRCHRPVDGGKAEFRCGSR
jgi:NAD(P)-dependent dehydrogenase (short-subunit alcohol dehydrogenase family)